ncbi:dihydrodipicolinate synthase family protein [Nonomuraea dietziae]|uniref:dihydrodipicolinate synthase family protein n=1 Tax=Nonomuraea dietziae TaxID=65515 RepID=UPI0031D75B98
MAGNHGRYGPSPARETLSADFEAFAEHCRWLVEQGCDGVAVNGSLGEYQTLSQEERAKVVETAVAAVGGRNVMAGVGAYGSAESRRWAEQARDAGCAPSCCCRQLLQGRREDRDRPLQGVAKGGLPIVAYNNPYDTKV